MESYPQPPPGIADDPPIADDDEFPDPPADLESFPVGQDNHEQDNHVNDNHNRDARGSFVDIMDSQPLLLLGQKPSQDSVLPDFSISPEQKLNDIPEKWEVNEVGKVRCGR